MNNAPNLPSGEPPRSLWRPIAITLISSLFLSFSTCAGAGALNRASGGLSLLLVYAGLGFLGLFFLTLVFAAIYFIIWISRRGV
jgi:hypothetical protein